MGNQHHKGWHSRGYLPHFDEPGRVQMISFRLADSLPFAAIERIIEKHAGNREEQSAAIEKYLDAGYGNCHLSDPRVASVVEDTLLKFDGDRYNLLAWVIMPNHVHVIIECLAGFPLDRVVHSWKSYTANQANKILGRKGRFWQPEYFDRYIRNSDSLESKIQYVHENPVKAGLVDKPEDWPFGSASFMKRSAGSQPASRIDRNGGLAARAP